MIRKYITILILVFILSFSYTSASSLLTIAVNGINNQYGKVNAFGTLNFYTVGTLTEKDVYSDASTTVYSQPITLDGSGRATVYIDGTYRLIIKDRNGVTIKDIASISSTSGGSAGGDLNDLDDCNVSTDIGTIAYRDAAGDFVGLAPGTSGYVLKTQGAGAEPTWVAQSGGDLNDLDDCNVGTTVGTIGYRDAAGDFVGLTPGTTGKVLMANTSSAPTWGFNELNNLSDVTGVGGFPSQGSLFYYNGSYWTALAPGTANYVLQSNGVGYTPTWVAQSAGATALNDLTDVSLTTTQGTIGYRDASGNFVGLGIGTTNQVLTSNGTIPGWSTPSVSPVPDKVINLVAGSFDYPNGATLEIAPLDYDDGTYNRIYFHAFDDSTYECVQSTIAIPDDWDNGEVTVEIYGYSSYSADGNTVWLFEHLPFNSSSSWDQSLTTQTSSATAIDSTLNQRSKITLSFTPSWADGDDIFLRIARDGNNGSDTLSGDFKMTSVRIILGRN